MLRRKARVEGSGGLLRAFEDTRKRSKDRHRAEVGEQVDEDAALEELVFGRHPFAGLEGKSTAYDSDSVRLVMISAVGGTQCVCFRPG